MSLFAALIQEKDYATLSDVGGAFLMWIRVAGVMAVIALVIAELYRLLTGRGSSWTHGPSGRWLNLPDEQSWKIRSYRFFLILIPIGLGLSGALFLLAFQFSESAQRMIGWSNNALIVGCAAAILAVSWEFLVDFPSLSMRRIWAIAMLSMKEAIRRKALWSFCVILLVFLFASWFIKTDRPEHQWRVYVQLVFFVMTALILITASVLACFSLPTDIRQQTIHTVITKPVQRFEIVLGRILGFGLLMTIVLFVMSHLSLLYVIRGIEDTAKKTSMRARVPVRGDLHFEQLDTDMRWVPIAKPINVGREWDYRNYIRGGSPMEAVWEFGDMPADLAGGDRMIPIEFTFDIFRTTKGGEDYREGVSCQIAFVNRAKWDFSNYTKYREAVDTRRDLQTDVQQVARDFGYYELPTPITVVDYQTFTVWFPSSVLEELKGQPFEIRVGCRSQGQYLGMAPFDLYVLAQEGSFYLNFLKGTLGIWFIMVLLITLGVVFSTYLNALVGLMLTWMMIVAGVPKIRSFITIIASSADPEINPGGGPFEAVTRLLRKENLITPLEQSRSIWLIQKSDDVMRVFFRGLLSIIPDLGLYDRTAYVAEGFNIAGGEVLVSFLFLIGYLFPFLLAGYYLLNAREVAN